ncbi:hypothetical protein SNEBB_008701 [Seison nebaliae]|nr:hypothetical protein SNEBB_008701 [Seison nebaliae]
MTTAARPTFDPAQGGRGKGESGKLDQLSEQYSVKDLPGHLTLKRRGVGQSNVNELKGKDFVSELNRREREVKGISDVPAIEENVSIKNRQLSSPSSSSCSSDSEDEIDKEFYSNIKLDPNDADFIKPSFRRNESSSSYSSSEEEDEITSSKRNHSKQKKNKKMKKSKDYLDESDSDDDEQERAELLAELEMIKKERALEEAKKLEKLKAEEEINKQEAMLKGNILLNFDQENDGRIKRNWNDDVVFKNCAKSEEKNKERQYEFVNDSLRSDFHRNFMQKYIR